MEVQIDKFEKDEFYKVVFEGETIEQSNKIEQLLWDLLINLNFKNLKFIL